MVRLVAFARGPRILLLFFTVHYLGTILRFPQSPRTDPLCQAPWPAGQRRGVCRSHLRVLAATFPAMPVCSGALEQGEPQTRERSQGWLDSTAPGWLPGKSRLCWAQLNSWHQDHQGHLGLSEWICSLSTGTSSFCAYFTDLSARQGLWLSPFHR